MGVSTDLTRAWSVFQVKSIDEEHRIIEGIASTPKLDRQGDVMESDGAVFTLPMPLLWQHRHDQPIGTVVAARATKSGIHIRAQIAKGVLPFIEDAWALIKSRLVRGLSIGWHPIKAQQLSGGRLHVTKWDLLEVSAVTVPANADTNITLIKSLDAAYLAAPGTRTHIPLIPGASGLRKGLSMSTPISEQIKAEQDTLQTKSVRLEELIQLENTDGALSAEDVKERDGLTSGIESLVGKIKRLSALESAQAAQSRVILDSPEPRRVSGQLPRVEVKDHAKELPKGTLFTRYAMAVAAGRGSLSDTLAYAKRWDSQTPEVSAYIKAIEGTSVVGSPAWGGELVFQNNLASEFVDLVRAQTIIGRVEGFRRAPFNVRIPVQSGGSTVNWVGEAAPKPVTELAFTTLSIPYHKMAGIIVLTEELVRLSNPDAEATVRRDLTDQISQFMDQQFIRIAVTAGANNPASITNGVSAPNASGTTLAALFVDLKAALGTFDTANITTEGLVIVTTPAVARILSMMTNQLGQTPNGFNVLPTGGTLMGYPVIVSASVDAATLVIFKPSEIFLADDGRVTLDASNQATLDMAGGSTPTFNLWQKDCIAIRAERWVTWVKRRTGVVAVIDTIAYVPGT